MRTGWRSKSLVVEKYHPAEAGFSTSELMALMQYDRINFERWVARGPALVDKGDMEEAELKGILSSFAARFVWAREVLEREKKFSFLARLATKRIEKKLSRTARQFSIWEDAKKEARHLAVVLSDKNRDEFSATQRFSRYILSVSPRLAHKDIALIDEADITGRILH